MTIWTLIFKYNKTFSSAKMAKCAKSLSRIVYWFILLYTNTFRHTRNQCVSALLWGRVFIDSAKRLLFCYQSVYSEPRIYTRRFGCKCKFVCKILNKRELIYLKKRCLCVVSAFSFLNDSESYTEESINKLLNLHQMYW